MRRRSPPAEPDVRLDERDADYADDMREVREVNGAVDCFVIAIGADAPLDMPPMTVGRRRWLRASAFDCVGARPAQRPGDEKGDVTVKSHLTLSDHPGLV